jgi:hypothetical protein
MRRIFGLLLATAATFGGDCGAPRASHYARRCNVARSHANRDPRHFPKRDCPWRSRSRFGEIDGAQGEQQRALREDPDIPGI